MARHDALLMLDICRCRAFTIFAMLFTRYYATIFVTLLFHATPRVRRHAMLLPRYVRFSPLPPAFAAAFRHDTLC